jgi:sugar phosphate permease
MIHAGFSPVIMVIAMLARGAGQGAIGLPSLSAAYASVPKEKLASATTATNIVQRIGGPITTTMIAMVLAFVTQRTPEGPQLYLVPFLALILVQVLVIVSASRLPVWIKHSA